MLSPSAVADWNGIPAPARLLKSYCQKIFVGSHPTASCGGWYGRIESNAMNAATGLHRSSNPLAESV